MQRVLSLNKHCNQKKLKSETTSVFYYFSRRGIMGDGIAICKCDVTDSVECRQTDRWRKYGTVLMLFTFERGSVIKSLSIERPVRDS